VHVQLALGLLVVVLAAGALLGYAFARRTGPSRRRQAEHDERMARAAEAFRRMPRRDDQSERENPGGVFRFLLVLSDGSPYEPEVFVTVVPSWSVGETFLITAHERLRIVAIDFELADELADAGINAVWTIEPVD